MHYTLSPAGYTLWSDGTVLFENQPEIAIVVDTATGTLHKHGQVAYAQAWHKKTQEAFRKHGFGDMADDIVCVCGAFDVEDINRCLSHTGYAGHLVKKILAES